MWLRPPLDLPFGEAAGLCSPLPLHLFFFLRRFAGLVWLSRAHRAGCPLGRRRRREDTLGALDGLAGVGEDCVARSVPSRRGLAVARAAPSVPAILWLAAHPRRRLQAARFATRAATRTAKGSECVSKSVDTRQAAQRGGGLNTRAPGAQGLSAGLARERRAAAKAEQLLVDL